MNDFNYYRVTVLGTFIKDVLVSAPSEIDAIEYVQGICDNTDLISFSEGDLVEVSAEEAIDLEDEI